MILKVYKVPANILSMSLCNLVILLEGPHTYTITDHDQLWLNDKTL